jgi:thiamine-phosphate pyrophosphorylase
MRFVPPRLYVILDAALVPGSPLEFARELCRARVRLLQYRNKTAPARELLGTARELVSVLRPAGVSLIVNDRADIAALAGAEGVHVGQEDLDVEHVRRIAGAQRWVGVSTHNLEQFRAAAASSSDYIAVGPVFATSSKANPDPVVGTQFIRQVRAMSDKPIVAIGGITLERAPSVIAAGADSVAVMSDILRAADPPERVRRYLEALGTANQAANI